MFEKEIKFIVDYNLNKIKSLGLYISFEMLAGSGVHPAIIQYISAELDYLIEEDRKKLLKHSVFDYSGVETAKYFNLIAQEIKKNKKIAYEDLKRLVIQAVSFNVNFLVRPRWSLSKLVFNDADSRHTDEIKLALDYVYYNDYLKKIFLSYLDKRKLGKLSLTEFESILTKIDNEVISADRQKMVDYSLFEIAEFFNPESRGEETENINKKVLPLSGIELFLKEKNLKEYLLRLKKTFPDFSKIKLGIEDIQKTIYSNIPVDVNSSMVEEESKPDEKVQQEEMQTSVGKEQEAQEKFIFEEESKEESVEPQADDAAQPKGKKADDSGDGIVEEMIDEFNLDSSIDDDLLSLYNESDKDNEEVRQDNEAGEEEKKSGLPLKNELDSLYDFEEETNQLLKEFDEAVPKDTIKEDSLEPETAEVEEDVNNVDTNLLVDEFMKQDKNGSGEDIIELDQQELQDESEEEMLYENKPPEKYLFDFISDKDIRKIISAVFNSDKDDFLSTVDKIGECANYEEATEILKGVFLTYRVNPYSKEAVALTNSVANFFNQA